MHLGTQLFLKGKGFYSDWIHGIGTLSSIRLHAGVGMLIGFLSRVPRILPVPHLGAGFLVSLSLARLRRILVTLPACSSFLVALLAARWFA